MANESEKMKTAVENIINSLNAKGIKVESAAVLKIGNKTTPQQDQVIDNAVDEVMSKLGMKQVQPLQNKNEEPKSQAPGFPSLPQNEDGTTVACLCPNCFSFETFEQQLAPKGGQFDYTQITMLGKKFDVKFHRDAEGKEHMMIEQSEFTPDPSLTLEGLQNALNQAVAAKEFDKAQAYLDAINIHKSKNQA